MKKNNKLYSSTAKKILRGLDLVGKKLLADAIEKKQELIVSQNNKIVVLKPWKK